MLRQNGRVLRHDRAFLALPEIEGFLRRSRTAESPEQHADLQRALAEYALDIRDFDRQLRDRIQGLRAELPVAKQSGHGERVREISKLIDESDIALAANKRRWFGLRQVQDGIIWRLLAYNRHWISILGQGEAVTWMSASFPSELAAAEEHWSAGRIAIPCDLSNCINTGDLLVIDPANQSVEPVELKQSARSASKQDTKQMQRGQAKVDFLNSGTSESLAPHVLHAPASRPRLRTHLSALGDALRKASTNGIAFVRASDAHALTAIDSSSNANHREVDPERRRQQLRNDEASFVSGLGNDWESATTVYWNSLEWTIQNSSHPIPSIAPYSVFPFDEPTCAKLILGYAAYKTLVNLDALDAALRRKGWTRIPTPSRPEAAGSFMTVQRAKTMLAVPTALAAQIGIELLTLASFSTSIADAGNRANRGDEPSHATWAWSNEQRVWR